MRDVPRLRARERLAQDAASAQTVAGHRASRLEPRRAQRRGLGVVPARLEVLQREAIVVFVFVRVVRVESRRRDERVGLEARHEPVPRTVPRNARPPAVAPPARPREQVAVARGVQPDGRAHTERVRGHARAPRACLQKRHLLGVVLGERVEKKRKRVSRRATRFGEKKRLARGRFRRRRTRRFRVRAERTGLGIRQTRLRLGSFCLSRPP